jgi:putative ABC transport system substrate-binding protein
MVKRRTFITLLGGGAAWPLAAGAQPAGKPVIGFLHGGNEKTNAKRVAAFRKGLAVTGFVEGQNVEIEFRWADGRNDRLPELAADLVRRQVAVIATPVSTQAALAAKAATATVPIVFAVGDDPIAMGLVRSLNRPGGNATGISILNVELTAKRISLLRELVPKATRFAAVSDPTSAMAEPFARNVEASAAALGLTVEILHAASDGEIAEAFARITKDSVNALLVNSSESLFIRRALIITLAARHALPTIYMTREYCEVGGLMSYGPDIDNSCEQTGIYAGRILKGEKPTELPVAQSTKFELVINLTTAKALALQIPNNLFAVTDEIIE